MEHLRCVVERITNSFLMQALGAKRLIDNIFCKSSSGIAVSLKPLVVQRRVPALKTLNRKAGFDIFCEKGYYKTNTDEIAKYAGVSIGAPYSYFEDKRQIFIESFHQHLDAISSALLQKNTTLTEQHK